MADLARGDLINLVIPLSEPLTINAGYRVYSRTSGWRSFDISTGDSLAFATGSPGICPDANSSDWRTDITETHNCIRLSITDGGSNDADGIDNGVVVSTGAIVNYSLENGCSMSVNQQKFQDHAEWPLLLMLLGWFGIYINRNKALV